MGLAELLLTAAAGSGAAFHLAASVRLRAHFRGGGPGGSAARFPVTFFRPVKPGTPGLREKLALLASCAGEEDQILVGVSGEEDRRIADSVPGIEVVAGGEPGIPNPKVAKLIRMAPLARHGHWILSDSEAILGRDLSDALRAEWGGVGLLTAGYRFSGTASWPQRLEQAALLASFWPGLAFAKREFALGALVAVRADSVRRIGGWEALGHFLAEDFQLGNRVARAGEPVRLSRHILPLESDPMGWGDWFFHQLRVAATLRACAPAGWAATPITHGVAPAALLAALAPGESWRWGVLAAALGARIACAAQNRRTLGAELRGLPLAAAAVSLLETFFWAASWLVRSVRWGGATFRLLPGGAIRAARGREIGSTGKRGRL
jgi:ceramide glucosyltransferase